MRVFVSGATGFIGSYLVTELLARGHQPAVLLREGSDPWRLREVLGRVHVIRGSLEDVEALREPLQAFAPESIAHLGWHGVANTGRNDPGQARNISATVELAALAADVRARTFVGAGSQAEYGPYDRMIREDDEARPTTLYGKAKLAAGSMAGQVCADRGLRFAWLRIFSTYGPRDNDIWLIPSTIRALKAGTRMPLTRAEQRWGFVHVRDAAAAFRIAIESPSARGLFNVGSSDAPPLRDTLERLRDLVDRTAELGFGDIPYRPDQVMILQADVGRLAALGWKPAIDFQTGLRETVAWYAERHAT
jgi:UDP-glucose 4-epimerase